MEHNPQFGRAKTAHEGFLVQPTVLGWGLNYGGRRGYMTVLGFA